MSNAAIRRAVAEDAPALTAMVIALNTHMGWDRCDFTEEHFHRDGLGDDRWFETWVAEADGELVGYAMCHRAYDTESAKRGSYLTDLYVAPEARQTGIGKALLGEVSRQTADWGGDVVWWLTTKENDVGSLFYEKISKSVEGLVVWVAAGEDFEALTTS